MTPLVRASNLVKVFGTGMLARWRSVPSRAAVDDVSFDIEAGTTLGLVGESGSGKSTLGRVTLGLIPPSSGHARVGRHEVTTAAGYRERKALWREAQMVFQDPYSSLDPRMTVHDALAEPLRNFGLARGEDAEQRIREVLDACGLSAQAASRLPREFSGGQRQRIGIARALIVRPRFVVADEPVSALDVSIQAQIVNLLQDLKAEFGLTYLFISHDLAVVRHVADRVAVMYRGAVVEIGPAEAVYETPLHPYTKLLLRSIPIPDVAAEAARLASRVAAPAEALAASPGAPPSGGCRFLDRCPRAELPLCATEAPPLSSRSGPHLAACHFADHQRQPVANPAGAVV